MADLSALLNSLADPSSKLISQREKFLRQMAENDGLIEYQFSIPVSGLSTGDNQRRFSLPDLPKGKSWLLGAAANVQARVTVAGSAGSTVVNLRVGSTDIAVLTVANTDTDNTYINGGSLSAAAIASGSQVQVDVDSIATGVTGTIDVRVQFSPGAAINPSPVTGP